MIDIKMKKEYEDKYPLTKDLVDFIKDLKSKNITDEEYVSSIEDFLFGYAEIAVDLYIRDILLGKAQIPHEDYYYDWSSEELAELVNRADVNTMIFDNFDCPDYDPYNISLDTIKWDQTKNKFIPDPSKMS